MSVDGGGHQPGFSFEPEPPPADAPLAARMRPRLLDEIVGQAEAIGPGSMLRQLLSRGRLPSVIFWGPPGCGKTTIAQVLARSIDAEFVPVSAVASGVAELRRVLETAARARRHGRRTVLFIDEIHRFNKAQQDVILPAVEDGTVILIGATTENPSFEVIAPLLSRTRVIRLRQLAGEEIAALVERALADPVRGLGRLDLRIDAAARDALVGAAGGDARAALTVLEIAADLALAAGRRQIGPGDVEAAVQDRRALHDRAGDAHYDTISAFIKSVRGSDPHAALYWLARLIEAGEDPLFIVRRMVILAAEDIGLADPQALVLAVACQQAVHFVGMPEGQLAMAECAVYLALAPKSNSTYAALGRAAAAAHKTSHLPVPLHLRNAVTGLMAGFGHGAGYRYAHDEPGHIARGQLHLPEALAGSEYYLPGELGFEAELVARWRALQQPAADAPPAAGPSNQEGRAARED